MKLELHYVDPRLVALWVLPQLALEPLVLAGPAAGAFLESPRRLFGRLREFAFVSVLHGLASLTGGPVHAD